MRLIDADLLKRSLDNYFAITPYSDAVKYVIDGVVMNRIDRQPTIDTVKHGEWIQSVDEDGCSIKTCSECGSEMPYVVPNAFSEEEWVEASDYCWHCGAKMG